MLDDEPARGLRQGADAPGRLELIAAEPTQRLPGAAKAYWRTVIGVNAFAALVVSLMAGGAIGETGGPGWALPVVVGILGVVAAIVVPGLRHRRWRYEIRDEEIDIRHGTFTIRRTLVPIRRVQHVDTESGVLQSMYELASVKFHTAAGATTIPAVRKGEADQIRRRVGELTKTRDDV